MMRKILLFFMVITLKAYSLDNTIKVEVKYPKKVETELTVETFGKIEANKYCSITSQTEGYFTSNVANGDFVKQGQIVGKTTNNFTDLKITSLLKEKEATVLQMQNLEEKIKSYEKLYQLGLKSKSDLIDLKNSYLTAKGQVESLDAQIKLLKLQKSKSNVVSNCQGYILNIVPDNTYIGLGTEVARVYNPNDSVLTLMLNYPYVNYLNKKLVDIKIQDRWTKATVLQIIPVSSSNLIKIKLKLEDNFNYPLNYTLPVSISLNKISAYQLPKKAVFIKDGETYILTVKNNLTKRVKVKVIKDLTDEVVLSGDFDESSPVVVSMPYALEDDVRVQVK